MAQAGGPDGAKANEALAAVEAGIREKAGGLIVDPRWARRRAKAAEKSPGAVFALGEFLLHQAHPIARAERAARRIGRGPRRPHDCHAIHAAACTLGRRLTSDVGRRLRWP